MSGAEGIPTGYVTKRKVYVHSICLTRATADDARLYAAPLRAVKVWPADATCVWCRAVDPPPIGVCSGSHVVLLGVQVGTIAWCAECNNRDVLVEAAPGCHERARLSSHQAVFPYIGDVLPKWAVDGAKVRLKSTPHTRKTGIRTHGALSAYDTHAFGGEIATVRRRIGNGWWDMEAAFERGREVHLTESMAGLFLPVRPDKAAVQT